MKYFHTYLVFEVEPLSIFLQKGKGRLDPHQMIKDLLVVTDSRWGHPTETRYLLRTDLTYATLH